MAWLPSGLRVAPSLLGRDANIRDEEPSSKRGFAKIKRRRNMLEPFCIRHITSLRGCIYPLSLERGNIRDTDKTLMTSIRRDGFVVLSILYIYIYIEFKNVS